MEMTAMIDLNTPLPMELAPTDGTEILAVEIAGGHKNYYVVRYDASHMPAYRWRGTYGDGDATFSPDGWWPLK